MAITLSSLAANSLGGSQASGTTSVNPTTQAFQKADQRIKLQRDLADVQLSSFGKLKSAFADTQTAAAALSDRKQTVSETDVRRVAGNFVKGFNSAVQTARSAATQPGTPIESGRARAAETELRRSVNTDAAVADLRKIGITQQANGTLAINNKVFDAALSADPEAVRGALSRVGQQVERTAASQLADGGNIGKAVNALSDRAKSLESRQTDQQALAAAAQQAVSDQTTRFNSSLNAGVAAYQRIFSA
jgi:flagellar capping protein FliD